MSGTEYLYPGSPRDPHHAADRLVTTGSVAGNWCLQRPSDRLLPTQRNTVERSSRVAKYEVAEPDRMPDLATYRYSITVLQSSLSIALVENVSNSFR